MSEVKRIIMWDDETASQSTEVVTAADYDALAAERNRLAGEVEALKEKNRELQVDSSNYRGKCGACGTACCDMLTDNYCADCKLSTATAEVARLTKERDLLRAQINWRKEPTYPNWGDVEIKNMDINTPEELADAARRLIDSGETLGGCGCPYGKHTGYASQFDEIAVGHAHLALTAENRRLREAAVKGHVWKTDENAYVFVGSKRYPTEAEAETAYLESIGVHLTAGGAGKGGTG